MSLLVINFQPETGLGQTGDNPSGLLEVPLIKQPYNMCLVASVSMVLGYYGLDISPSRITEEVPIYKDGATGRDLQRFVGSLGFQGFLIQPGFDDLVGHLRKGRPLIVALPGPGRLRHALVLVGYDGSSLWFNDPAGGKRERRDKDSFLQSWDETHHWTFLILPKSSRAEGRSR